MSTKYDKVVKMLEKTDVEINNLVVEQGNESEEALLLHNVHVAIQRLVRGETKKWLEVKKQKSESWANSRCPICGRARKDCQGHKLCPICHAPEGKPHGKVWDKDLRTNVYCSKGS